MAFTEILIPLKISNVAYFFSSLEWGLATTFSAILCNEVCDPVSLRPPDDGQ